MAKSVLFESEREARRRNAMRFVIPAAALLGVLLVTVAVTLLVRGGRAVSGGTDTPYPYAYIEKKDGSITLELDRSAAPGYQWELAAADPGVRVEPARSGAADKSRFALTPESAGRYNAAFRLLPEGADADAIYEITFFIEVTDGGEQLRAALTGASSRAMQAAVEGGGDTRCPYRVSVDEDGDLVIAVTENEEDESGRLWNTVSDREEIAEAIGLITAEGVTTAYFRPGAEAGTCMLHLTDAITGTEITVECENAGNGSLTILSHSIHADGE